VFARAEDVLGTSEKAARWMHSPILALASHTPLELLDTDLGAQWVTDVLGRIEWGVYS
jgi:putative toxin-antitoxin system antitoxin component (TIGR02293 family)